MSSATVLAGVVVSIVDGQDIPHETAGRETAAGRLYRAADVPTCSRAPQCEHDYSCGRQSQCSNDRRTAGRNTGGNDVGFRFSGIPGELEHQSRNG